MSLKEVSKNKTFEGHVIKYEHHSEELGCDMKFNVFLPKESITKPVPAIYFLSGLTCTEDNFIQKSGAIAEAAKHGIALVAPDTSPRKEQDKTKVGAILLTSK
jgi:S-formylglutathione hydrolase